MVLLVLSETDSLSTQARGGGWTAEGAARAGGAGSKCWSMTLVIGATSIHDGISVPSDPCWLELKLWQGVQRPERCSNDDQDGVQPKLIDLARTQARDRRLIQLNLSKVSNQIQVIDFSMKNDLF